MVPINKTEKDLLVKAFPPHKYPHYYCYPRTMKQDSKRGRYFCVESPELLAKLNKFDIQGLVMTAVVPYLVFMFASSLYDLLASRPRCGSLY